MLTCDECDHTAKNANNTQQYKVDKHRIEQLDGNDEVTLTVQEEEPVVLKINRHVQMIYRSVNRTRTPALMVYKV